VNWFKRVSSDAKACSFCGAKRGAVSGMVSGPSGVGICNNCITHAATQVDRGDALLTWGWMATQMAVTMPEDRLEAVEPLAYAAAVLAQGNVEWLRGIADAFAAVEGVPHARGLLVITQALGPEQITARDARRAVTAALLAGELDLAAEIKPAAQEDLAKRSWLITQHQVALVRAPAGSIAIDKLLEAIDELHKELHEDGPATLLDAAAMTHAYACARAGQHAAAVKRYAPFRKRYDIMRPWHVLAYADALEGTGDTHAATDQWKRVAEKAAWEPYWPERARERLSAERAPYR
jgi:hypothetical protein